MIKDIKPKLHETDIRMLIDRYMSGDTTNEEEATLRTWFRLAGDDIPEEWRPLRALFCFVDEQRSTTLQRAMHRPRIWISSAASLVRFCGRGAGDAAPPQYIADSFASSSHLDFVSGGSRSHCYSDACAVDEQSFRPGTAKLCCHRRKAIHQSRSYKRAGG